MIAAFLVLLLGFQFDSVFRQGLIALNNGDLKQAREQLESATEIQPGSGEAWTALAQTYLKLGQAEKADKAALKAAEAAGGNIRVLRALLLYYRGRHQPESVIRTARQALRVEDKPDLRQVLGQAYFELSQPLLQAQEFDAAAKILEAGAKELPDNAQLQLALGVAQYGQRRFPEATGRFLDTIRIAPEIEQPYVFLGKILEHAGDRLSEVRQRFEAYRQLHPNDAMANLLSAKVLIAQPPYDQAAVEKLLRESIAANDGLWEPHFELGVQLAKARQYEDARKELNRAIELNPKEAVPHYHLARVYDRLGRPEEARAERAIHAQLLSAAEVK